MSKHAFAGALWIALCIAPAVRAGETVESQHPGLASGMLTHARLAELPEDVVLKSGDIVLTKKDVAAAIGEAPEHVREQLEKNAFFMLEQMATERLLLAIAKKDVDGGDKNPGQITDRELIREYLDRVVKDVAVSDAEIKTFYAANEHLFGGAKLDEVKDSIRSHLLGQKRQEYIGKHLRGLGPKLDVAVSAGWTKQQAALALDNPVDKARSGGKPALVAFSGAGCCGPDQILPLLETVREKWPKAVAVVYVEAAREPVLAARYGVQSIPTLILHDSKGRESARWSGAVEFEALEGALKKAGIK